MTEQQPGRRIEVYPCATQTSEECFPCIAVEVFNADATSYKTWVDLRKLGRHFNSLSDAMGEAKKVKVIEVHPNGRVEWEYVAG